MRKNQHNDPLSSQQEILQTEFQSTPVVQPGPDWRRRVMADIRVLAATNQAAALSDVGLKWVFPLSSATMLVASLLLGVALQSGLFNYNDLFLVWNTEAIWLLEVLF